MPFKTCHLVLMAISFLMLLKFGRRSLRIPGWIVIPLISLAGLGGLAGPNGLNAACRYALGLPGAMLTGCATQGGWNMGGSLYTWQG